MRKNTLRKTVNQYLKMNRTGSLRDKKQREHVTHKLIHDLFVIKNIPLGWEALTSEHFHQLMKLWHKQRLQPATIMKHMTIIRGFLMTLGYDTSQISNQQLGLKTRKKPSKTLAANINIWGNTKNPIAHACITPQYKMTFNP